MDRQRILSQFRANMYYIVIFVVSIIVLIFLPMFGSEVGIELNLPNTVAGWCVYVATKLIVAGINVIIFHSFMQQAKINVKDNEQYREGLRIMGEYKDENYKPMAPSIWVRKQYLGKATTIFLMSVLGAFAFTQALLTYDYITAITYFITIIMGIIFGILQMSKAEEYWTQEFYDYCKMIEKEQMKSGTSSFVRIEKEQKQKLTEVKDNVNQG